MLQFVELIHRNLFGQGPPTIAVAQQDEEIGLGRDLLRPPQFIKTDPHRPVIQPGLRRNAPAQVNGLELKPLALAELLQFRKGLGRQSISLMLHIAERRADKHPNDGPETRCRCRLCHYVWSFLFILQVAGQVEGKNPCGNSFGVSALAGPSRMAD